MATKAERKHYGYVRVSTDDQAENGVSLEAQRDRVRAFAVATGRELAGVLSDEGASAKSLDRPALAQILEDVRAGRVASITVLKLDRLTRSIKDLAELLELFSKRNVALVSVCESLDTSTSVGRLMLHILGSVSQWEREAIGERTAIALAHKRRNRRAYASTPFGFRREGDQLVADPERQLVLERVRKLRAAGTSFAAIAEVLNREDVAPPRGAQWYGSSVHAVLNSRMALED